MEGSNQQRNTIFHHITKQTPQEYQERAAAFMSSAEALDLSPRTIAAMFSLGKKHTDRPLYDIRNLSNLKFHGIDQHIQGTSVTGQPYHYGIRFKNRQDNESDPGKGMGWTTGEKLLQSLQQADIDLTDLPTTNDKTAKDHDEARRKKKDYLETIDQALKNPELIKDIQSVNERRKVRALQGLDEAVKEASGSIYESFNAFLQSKEFYSESAHHILELLLPKGGLIKRLKVRDDLPERIEKILKLVANYKRFLTLEQQDEYMTTLEAFDQETSLIDMRGHAQRYINDLQDIARKKPFKERPQALLHILAQLQAEQPVGTASNLAAFVQLYDVNKERMENYEQTINRSPSFLEDYASGEAAFKQVFIEGAEWLGGKDDNIPITISESLEGIVKKRGDPFLKEAQRWLRGVYASEDMENNITTKSMRETGSEVKAIVILERRKQAKERQGHTIIDDKQQPAEDFEKEYDIKLDEFLDRMEDQHLFSHHKKGDWQQERRIITHEAQAKLYVPERFESFAELIGELRDNFIPYTDDERKTISEYQDLQRQTHVLSDLWVEQLYFSAGKKYVKAAEIEQADRIIAERGETIRKAYKDLENRTERSLREHQEIIRGVSDDFKRSDLASHRKVVFYGTLFEEKDDLKKTFAARWDPQEKQWYIQPQKARISERLDAIRKYNESHKGKLTVDLR